jgi:hypothetical protein
MHLLPGVAIQPNLELKTQPKLVLGSLPLAFALPAISLFSDTLYFVWELKHGLPLNLLLSTSFKPKYTKYYPTVRVTKIETKFTQFL